MADPVPADADLELLSAAQQRLGDAGFGDQLVAAGSSLRVVTTGHSFDPATLVVHELVRFEGVSDPDDEAILFAVATSSGDPVGTYTVPYGPDMGAEDVAIVRRLLRRPGAG